jgi:PhnB protein
VENFRLHNDDGSIHVAELTINDALFHLHEATEFSTNVSPEKYGTSTVTIGLMTEDVHAVFNQAVSAGATVINPVTDFEYGYRQGDLRDPFGHHWCIQCRIPVSPDWEDE